MMKQITKKLMLFISALTLSWSMQAQIVGTDAFLQGSYVEVGVNTCGAYASNAAPPAGYYVTGLTGLNFIADPDGDGWDAGSPGHCGDYAIPGSPVEGWGVKIGGSSYYNTDKTCFTSDIDGEIVSYTAEGDSVVVEWEGSVASVDILQRSVLYTDNYYIITTVTFTNNTGGDIIDMYYRRNIDPDNEQQLTASFVTTNTVVSSPYAGDVDALVTGIGNTYGCYLGIGARNPNARVSYGNFGTTSGTTLSDSYDGLSGFNLSGSFSADQAIQITFVIPFLADGESTTIAFAHIFNEDYVESALEDTYVGGYDDCAGIPEVTPSSSTETTTCASTVFTVATSVPTAAGYSFQWQSSADGVDFSDIAGAIGSTYTTTQTSATWYQCVVTCTVSGESAIADPVFVDNLCPGCMDPGALNYNAEANTDDGSCLYGYTISDCDYEASLLAVPDGLTEICLGDDDVSSAVAIGFDFPFYGTLHSDVYISSNGYLSFNSDLGNACCSGAILPDAAYPNSIFFAQEDLDPNTCVDGDIWAWIEGDAGSQVFVVAFVGVPHYPGPAGTDNVTVQVQLFEATGEIKIVTTEMNAASGNHTMGLNLDGTLAQPVEGRNSTYWEAFDECILFSPAEAGSVCAPIPPTGIYVDGISSSGATIHWDAMANADQYIGALWNLSTGAIGKFKVAGDVTSYTTASVMPPSTTFGIRIKTACFDEGVISPYSEWVYFTTDPLRLGEFSKQVSVFPNPNDGTFRIQLNGYETGTADVLITNTVGQTVYNATISVDNNASVHDVSLPLAPGTYFVKVINGAEIVTNAIVVE